MTSRDAARKVKDIDFEVGDFVLVYVARQRNKMRVKWAGPFKVVDTINPVAYVCENLVTGERYSVHTSRLRKYADSLSHVTADLKKQAAHDFLEFYPDRIVGWRETDEGLLELKIRWLGFDAMLPTIAGNRCCSSTKMLRLWFAATCSDSIGLRQRCSKQSTTYRGSVRDVGILPPIC